jgi:hypothetical protein
MIDRVSFNSERQANVAPNQHDQIPGIQHVDTNSNIESQRRNNLGTRPAPVLRCSAQSRSWPIQTHAARSRLRQHVIAQHIIDQHIIDQRCGRRVEVARRNST